MLQDFSLPVEFVLCGMHGLLRWLWFGLLLSCSQPQEALAAFCFACADIMIIIFFLEKCSHIFLTLGLGEA